MFVNVFYTNVTTSENLNLFPRIIAYIYIYISNIVISLTLLSFSRDTDI